ncbi:hypothetical protein V5799_024994, partial [Amblyomma americanum]
ILGTQEEKSSIQTSVFNVIEGNLPVAFPGMPPSSMAVADTAWRQTLSGQPREPLQNLDMDHIIQASEVLFSGRTPAAMQDADSNLCSIM